METQIEYRLATMEDYNSVLDFIRQHFFPYEPLNLAFKPLKQDVHEEKATMSNIANGICVIAVSCEQIVGVGFAGPKYPGEEKKLLKASSLIPNTKWARELQFLATLEKDSNVWQKYGVEKAMHGGGLAVHKNFGRRGIGQTLLLHVMKRASELGFPLYSVNCTSIYSARLCERLGMELVNICELAEYREPNNDSQVFFPLGEHKFVRTYALRLL